MLDFLPPNDYFPVRALPESLRNVTQEIEAHTNAPLAIVYAGVMTAVSLACQKLFDVSPREGLVYPTSQFFMTIADSGDRKTTTDKLALKAVRDYQSKMTALHTDEMLVYKAARLAHEEVEKGILRAIKKKAMDIEARTTLTQELALHLSSAPVEPQLPKLIYSDATIEALLHGLHKDNGAAGIVSDEAAGVLGGRLMSALSHYNTLWGGGDITVDRRSSDSYILEKPRVSVSLAIQPAPFDKFMKNRGDQARGIGFLARFWISKPVSTQGSRMISDQVPKIEYMPQFDQRITELLKQSFDSENASAVRRVLRLSREAQDRWVDEFNAIERSLGANGFRADIKDFCSKYAEGVARKAALFHLFSGEEGDISLATLEASIAVGSWYMTQFRSLFGMHFKPPQEEIDATVLDDWLHKNYVAYSTFEVAKTEVRQNCPYALRADGRFDAALDCLERRGRVRFAMLRNLDTRRTTRIVQLLNTPRPFFPNYLPASRF